MAEQNQVHVQDRWHRQRRHRWLRLWAQHWCQRVQHGGQGLLPRAWQNGLNIGYGILGESGDNSGTTVRNVGKAAGIIGDQVENIGIGRGHIGSNVKNIGVTDGNVGYGMVVANSVEPTINRL